MFATASPLGTLMDAAARPGLVGWIGVRPARRVEMQAVAEAMLDPAQGVDGDRYRANGQRTRQVSLIQAEHLVAVAAFLGSEGIDPALVRRNIVVAGINLLALKGRHLRLGDAVLEITGPCHPCSRMGEVLGVGGYNAMRGHGGMTARIVSGGMVRIGDAVMRVEGG